ncbi:hypothetical protein I7I50_11753 [Histoplasma capsulatum G186AR]|uniref:Uncharacterized protein n=1 Tax=Ajellomyces capsulatus TaxID=5037 RepID=A0A8H7Z8P7_AJECA|nr:hypothetical protein I7I52_02991 [Histoplasma capsulatum]QSS70199.1 hypothetical protein I7I50_11753 [Histoplasma capsulatum G186AR]
MPDSPRILNAFRRMDLIRGGCETRIQQERIRIVRPIELLPVGIWQAIRIVHFVPQLSFCLACAMYLGCEEGRHCWERI